jgi:hypothetical protein
MKTCHYPAGDYPNQHPGGTRLPGAFLPLSLQFSLSLPQAPLHWVNLSHQNADELAR